MEKKTLKTTDNFHIRVLVICIRTYIYRILNELKTSNRGIQALYLALRKIL